jgi:hypothetical protein
MAATLPVEMWTDIVQYLPPARRRDMLRVSRLLHDIAIRFVFATVKIYFMHQEPAFYMLNTENERYVRETSDYLLNRSWEMLHCIITKPLFANVVKTLSVHAFTDGPAVFDLRNCLACTQPQSADLDLQVHWHKPCNHFPIYSPFTGLATVPTFRRLLPPYRIA